VFVFFIHQVFHLDWDDLEVGELEEPLEVVLEDKGLQLCLLFLFDLAVGRPAHLE
jgi:hypothetical protein